jgi:hypothetical protein
VRATISKVGKLAGIILLASMSLAYGAFFHYSEWERMPEEAQDVYLAGAFDAFVGIAVSEDPGSLKRSIHYQDCLHKSNMTLRQLSQNVIAFASAKPELQRSWVIIALGVYLQNLCGSPPNN